MITYLPRKLSLHHSIADVISKTSLRRRPFPSSCVLSDPTKQKSTVIKVLNNNKNPFIVKFYFHSIVKGIFRHKDYGLIEYENYHKALAQGIPTIPPMAYFRRTIFGLTVASGLVFHFDKNHCTVEKSLISNPTGGQELMKQAAQLLSLLAKLNLNYIDFTPANLLLDIPTKKINLIDFKHLYPLHTNALDYLVVQASHFLNHISDSPQKGLHQVFTKHLYLKHNTHCSYEEFEKLVKRQMSKGYKNREKRRNIHNCFLNDK